MAGKLLEAKIGEKMTAWLRQSRGKFAKVKASDNTWRIKRLIDNIS